MEIETAFEGVHPDGMKFRVRRIDDMYYYAVQIPDDYGIGWVWLTVDRSPSKKAIVDRVIADRHAKQRRKRRMLERG